MRLETFFEKFELFADAPNAVQKMRELVLQLAVTGKLVPQQNAEEDASVLLESVKGQREQLVTERKIKSRATAPVEPDQVPFDLPSSWVWARLSDVGYELGQKVPDNRFTYIDVGGIDSDKGCISDRVEQLEPNDAPSRARKLVSRGTVIYSTVRPYLLNIAIVDRDYDPEPIASTAFGILHPFAGINNRYLFYWLRSTPFTAYVQASMKGMAYPAINDEKFYSGYIALPPLAEQKRIAAKVDELMALCDQQEAQQEARERKKAQLARSSFTRFAEAPTPANLQYIFHRSYDVSPTDLRKLILTLAVQGMLIPQDPNDEPARVQLERISQQKKVMLDSKQIRQGKVSRPQTAFDSPAELPFGWEWVNIDALCFKVTDGTHFTPRYTESGVRFVSAKDISGGVLRFDRCKFISPEEHEQLYRRCNPAYHDIVISKSGSIGTVALIEDRDEFSLFESLALLKFDQSNLCPNFFVYALTHSCTSLTAGHIRGVGVKHLHLDILRGLEMAIPPLKEQRRIVAKVDQLMSLVEKLERQLSESRARAENLIECVVAELSSVN